MHETVPRTFLVFLECFFDLPQFVTGEEPVLKFHYCHCKEVSPQIRRTYLRVLRNCCSNHYGKFLGNYGDSFQKKLRVDVFFDIFPETLSCFYINFTAKK